MRLRWVPVSTFGVGAGMITKYAIDTHNYYIGACGIILAIFVGVMIQYQYPLQDVVAKNRSV